MNGETTDSPLEALAGTAGPGAIDAFSVIANETRLAILLALWETYDPLAEDNTLSFTQLRDRVGMDDSGQFNYHLSKLEERYLRSTEEGYELRQAGLYLVQAVIAGAGLEEPSLERTEIDHGCGVCDATGAVTYQDGWIYFVCTECDGYFGGWRDDLPDGTLTGNFLFPASVTDRSPGAVLNATWVRGRGELFTHIEGVCSTCAGPMERWLHYCDDHAQEGVCTTCGRWSPAGARFQCSVCKHYHEISLPTLVRCHPAVIAFYYERDLPLVYESDETDNFQPRYRERHHDQFEVTLIATNPPQAQVTLQYEGDEVRVTLDEGLEVTEVTGPDSA